MGCLDVTLNRGKRAFSGLKNGFQDIAGKEGNSQGHIEVWSGVLGCNVSATTRVISRFGLVWVGLVCEGKTPQQQPSAGSYRGGEMMRMKVSVSLVEETGVPRGNHRPLHIRPVPSLELDMFEWDTSMC